MTKPRLSSISSGERASLLATANRITQRVEEVTETPAKDRALELARLVLANNPSFGGRSLADEQIIALLGQENIGLATFRKSLSTVRKELVKRPARSIGKKPQSLPRAEPLVQSPKTRSADWFVAEELELEQL